MRNLGASLFYFAARVAAAALQLRLVAHFFGAQYAGLNVLLYQLAYYVALIELGLAAAAISLLYEPIKNAQVEHVSGLLCALQRDTRRLMLLALPIVAALVVAYARSVHSTLPPKIVLATFALTAVSGLVTLLSIHYQAYLNASEQMYKIHLVLGFGHIAKTAIGLTLAIALHNYLWVPIVIAAISVVEVAALRLGFHLSFPQYIPGATREFFSIIRARAKWVLFHRVGSLIYYQSDFIILSLATTLVLVKDYAQVQYIVMGIVGLFSAVANALTASLARRHIDVSAAGRWRQYRAVSQANYFVALATTLAFFFSARQLVWMVFGSNAPGTHTMLLFASLLLLNLVRAVDDTYITATGSFQVGFYLPVLEGPFYIAVGVFLSRRLGMDGVLWAGILTNVLFVVIAKSVVVAHAVFSGSVARIFAIRFKNIIEAAVLSLPLLAIDIAFQRAALSRPIHFLAVSLTAATYSGAIGYAMIRRGFKPTAADGQEHEREIVTKIA
jgi:O-antigen/teichoic acid export membrane protein